MMAITTRQVFADAEPRPGPIWDALKQEVREWGVAGKERIPPSPNRPTSRYARTHRSTRARTRPVPRRPPVAERRKGSRSPCARPLTLVAESRSQTDALAASPESQVAPNRRQLSPWPTGAH